MRATSRRAWDLDHSSNAFFAACDGTGSLPGTDCKMDGWNKESVGPHGSGQWRLRVCAAAARSSHIGRSRSSTSSPTEMFASNLDGSFVAHQYVVAAYSSRRRRLSGRSLGMRRREGRHDADAHATANHRPSRSRMLRESDDRRRGRRGGRELALLRRHARQQRRRHLVVVSRPTARSYNGPDWSKDVINPPSQFLTDVGKRRLASITWITPTYETSDHPGIEREQRAGVGRERRRRRSARASSGNRRRSSSCGTIGADGSIRCSRSTKITTASVFACRC